MTKLTRLTGVVALGVALAGGSTMAFAFKGQEYAKEAKASLTEARATALKTVVGKITDQELEKEQGGSGLRYSFDVKTDRATHEVGVDAKTGAVLENSIDGPNAD
ncbi:MAG TPA: PepSY domain-containing protein [Stellaceae bacterium]|nr:PepSY domain-containing protein [Stellaceae bacterium]